MKRILLAIALACGAVSTPPALAQPGTASAVRQAPLSRVLAILAQRWPGKQLDTQMGDAQGRPTYVIRWQMSKDGRVVQFVVDAESGQLLSGPTG